MNVLKGLGGGPTRRLKLWGLKNEENRFWNALCTLGRGCTSMVLKMHKQNLKFDYNASPTSNNNNSLNLNLNYIEFLFKINPRMSIFQ